MINEKPTLYISLLFVLTCAKEDSQAPNTPPTQIVKQYALTALLEKVDQLQEEEHLQVEPR